VTVYVTDVNDNSPTFVSSISASASGAVTSPKNISAGLVGEVIVVSSYARLGSVVARVSTETGATTITFRIYVLVLYLRH